MIQKETWIKLTDSSQAQWLKVFHLYAGFSRKKTHVGLAVKGSIRIILPPMEVYKGFNLKLINKGKIVRTLLTRQLYKSDLKSNQQTRQSFINTGVVLKKKNNILEAHLLGPVMLNVRKKRFVMLFKGYF